MTEIIPSSRSLGFLVALTALLFLIAHPASSHAASSPVPLCFHIGEFESRPVYTDEKLRVAMAHLTAALQPFEVAPIVRGTNSFIGHEVRGADDRDALRKYYREGCVNVFVPMRIFNTESADEPISGVRWRVRANTGISYIILSANAAPDVLAHELGHYFGLGHSRDRHNIMFGGPGFREYGSGYNEDQGKTIRRWFQMNSQFLEEENAE
jgi:hypothetical protein